MLKNKRNIGLILLVLMAIGLACDAGNETTEANKLVDEANVSINKSNEFVKKSGKLFSDLLGENMPEVTDIQAYQIKNKSKFDELISLSEQASKGRTEATAKFEAASKLKLDEKYKEYLQIKVQEMKKRIEGDELQLAIVKKFIETKDNDEWNKAITEFNKNAPKVTQEADDLEKKADQIAKDNPDLIK